MRQKSRFADMRKIKASGVRALVSVSLCVYAPKSSVSAEAHSPAAPPSGASKNPPYFCEFVIVAGRYLELLLLLSPVCLSRYL